jgi:hypothetical protein
MKVINIMLEDAEHKELFKAKGEMTWRESLIKGCKG